MNNQSVVQLSTYGLTKLKPGCRAWASATLRADWGVQTISFPLSTFQYLKAVSSTLHRKVSARNWSCLLCVFCNLQFDARLLHLVQEIPVTFCLICPQVFHCHVLVKVELNGLFQDTIASSVVVYLAHRSIRTFFLTAPRLWAFASSRWKTNIQNAIRHHQTMPNRPFWKALLEKRINKKNPLPWEPACFVTHALLAGPKNTPLHQWLPMAHPGSHCLVVAEVGFNEDLGSCQGLEGSMKLLEGFLQWLLLPWKTNTVLKKNKNNHPSSLTGSSSQSTVFFVRLCEASHVVCVENVGWWQVFHFPNQQLPAEALSEISLVCCLILWLKTAKAKPWWAWNIVAFELHTNIVNIC